MRKVQLRLIFFGPFDHRVDDIGLAAQPDLFADEIPHFRGSLGGNPPGCDGRASGRQLIQYAQIQIAVERQGQRARNRRRGHHQHVWLSLIGLLHQLESLQHAEAVLLVDHDEAQPVELDFLFDERVRADDQLRLAPVDEGASMALAVFVKRTGQQHDLVAAGGPLEQLARG